MHVLEVTITTSWLENNTVFKSYKKTDNRESFNGRFNAQSYTNTHNVSSQSVDLLPCTYKSYPANNQLHVLYEATAITAHAGCLPDCCFPEQLSLDFRQDNEDEVCLWLCTDERCINTTSIHKGVLFETFEQAHEFQTIYKSISAFYKSECYKKSKTYLFLSLNTYGVYLKEQRDYASEILIENKMLTKKQLNLEKRPAKVKAHAIKIKSNKQTPLISPDKSEWIIISLDSKLTKQQLEYYFPVSLKTHKALCGLAREHLEYEPPGRIAERNTKFILAINQSGFFAQQAHNIAGDNQVETECNNLVPLSALTKLGLYRNHFENTHQTNSANSSLTS